MNCLYRYLERCKLTQSYVSGIRFRMSILFPENIQRIEEETRKRVIRNLFGFLGIFVFLCSFEAEFYWAFSCAAIGFCMMGIWEKAWEYGMNLRILKELQSFINDLSFAFRCRNSLEEAFWEVLLDTCGLMKMHGEFLYEMISETRYEDNYRVYKEAAPNEFFLLFYVLSHMTKQEGDTLHHGKSLYGENLKNLSRDIAQEILYLEKNRYAFAGLQGICLLPVFVIKPIEIWATANIPALQNYYESSAGKLQTLLLVILSMGIFRVIAGLKYPAKRKNTQRSRFAPLRYWSGMETWLDRRIQKKYGMYLRIWQRLKSVCSDRSLKEFLAERYVYGIMLFVAGLLLSWSIKLSFTAMGLFAVTAGVCGYYLPLWEVFGRSLMLRGSTGNEMIRFYTIIGMCCRQESMDVYTLLLHLEMLSVNYESLLVQATDTYEGSGLEALEKLKEAAGDKAFIRLVEGLIACDEMPVAQALEFTFQEREYQAEDKQIRDERKLADRAALGRFLSFIPFFAVILVKLILPFVMEGLKELEVFNNSLNLLM